MKTKFLFGFALLLIMTMAVSACGSNLSAAESKNDDEISPTAEEQNVSMSAWVIATEVDEFGDVVENSDHVILKSIAGGDFSNTATTSSDLIVDVRDTIYGNHVFYFTLYEYSKTPATYTSSSEITLKTKIGDDITSYTLDGDAPNGPVFLGINDEGGNDIFNALYAGNDVRCIISIDNSQYNFTISSSGFKEICSEAQEKLDAITEKNRIKDISSVINNILISEDGAAKLLEAYDYLADSKDEYTLMSDADIKSEIDGDFYYTSLSEYNDNGIILTYRYIMNYKGNVKTQKLYWKYGVSDENPEKQNSTSKFEYADGIITSGVHPCQIRKMTDGYYVAYESDGADYTIPCWVIMKGHQDTKGFVFDYPLPDQ